MAPWSLSSMAERTKVMPSTTPDSRIRVTRVSLARGMRPRWNIQHTSVSYKDGLPIRHLVYKYNIRVTMVSLARGMRPRWNMKHISTVWYRDGLPIRHLVYEFNIRVTSVSLARGMRPRWNMKHITRYHKEAGVSYIRVTRVFLSCSMRPLLKH